MVVQTRPHRTQCHTQTHIYKPALCLGTDPPPTASFFPWAATAFLIALMAVGGTRAPCSSFTAAPSATMQGSWSMGGETDPDPDGHNRAVATASTTTPPMPLVDSTSINVTPSKDPAGGDGGCQKGRGEGAETVLEKVSGRMHGRQTCYDT